MCNIHGKGATQCVYFSSFYARKYIFWTLVVYKLHC